MKSSSREEQPSGLHGIEVSGLPTLTKRQRKVAAAAAVATAAAGAAQFDWIWMRRYSTIVADSA